MTEAMKIDRTDEPAMAPVTVRAAAVQLEAVVGDVAENMRRVEALIEAAALKGATLIAVPEFCTSRIMFDARVHEAVLPPENPMLDLFRRLAKRHGARIGGSMLIAEEGEVYNRYHLVEPDGKVHRHDKDLPTMWENAFYGPGRDDGVFETGIGGVGAAVCWELIRTQTVRRMLGRVDVAMTGTHWWTLPTNWGDGVSDLLAGLGQYNRYLSENAPVEFARRLGAPVLQASHCGRFRGGFMLLPGTDVAVPYETEFVGATQIVDADGHVLAHRRTHEGPGVVVADLDLGHRVPDLPLSEGFWIPALPLLLRLYWSQQNLCGRGYYQRSGRRAGLLAASRV